MQRIIFILFNFSIDKRQYWFVKNIIDNISIDIYAWNMPYLWLCFLLHRLFSKTITTSLYLYLLFLKSSVYILLQKKFLFSFHSSKNSSVFDWTICSSQNEWIIRLGNYDWRIYIYYHNNSLLHFRLIWIVNISSTARKL